MITDANVIIERTKNKHSRALIKGDAIVVRLAKNLSKSQEQHHINSLVTLIQKKKITHCNRTLIDPFSFNWNHTTKYVPLNTGECITVRFLLANKNRFTTIKSTTWQFAVTKETSEQYIKKRLWKELSEYSTDFFTQKTHELNKLTFNKPFSTIKVQHGISKWGSCSSTGIITLNPALLFVPEIARDYVIVHELAHLIEQNHSKNYWNTVLRVWPEYVEHKKLLHQFRLQ